MLHTLKLQKNALIQTATLIHIQITTASRARTLVGFLTYYGFHIPLPSSKYVVGRSRHGLRRLPTYLVRGAGNPQI